MEFVREILPGAHLIKLRQFQDARGSFVKTYARSVFNEHGAEFEFCEEFYSVSAKNVIRGMHFQIPPYDHVKMVYCPIGAVLDVLVDLRPGRQSGHCASVVLDAAAPALLIIPKGVAHGFKALQDNTMMVYKTSTEHAPSHDRGIRWDSFGFDWDCTSPVISERDNRHPSLSEFLDGSADE